MKNDMLYVETHQSPFIAGLTVKYLILNTTFIPRGPLGDNIASNQVRKLVYKAEKLS